MNEDEIKAIIVRACKAYHGAMLDPYSECTYTINDAVRDISEIITEIESQTVLDPEDWL